MAAKHARKWSNISLSNRARVMRVLWGREGEGGGGGGTRKE
jgi:hypothetical protein